MRNSRLLTLVISFSVMVLSCETAITEYPYLDISGTESAGSEAKVSQKMKIQVTEEIAEILLQGRDSAGNISPEAIEKAGFGHECGIESMSTTFMIGGKFEPRQRSSGLHLWFDVVFSDNAVETKSFIDLPNVNTIHEAPKMRLNEIVDDPDFLKQWHYWNQGGKNYQPGSDIRLKEAWEIYGEYGSNEVIVAVFDSGIDCEHPDLHDNMWVNLEEKNGVEGVDDDKNGYVDDVYGYNFVENKGIMSVDTHGTHVAGTVAAVNNNGIGVAGVAGGRYPEQGVRIMALQVIHGNESGDFEKAVQYATENGAVIAQNSWGYQSENIKNIMPSDKRAIDYFIENAGIDENGNQTGPMKGGLVVFAAGNDGRDYGYPGQYERALAVASIGPDGKAPTYTNYGDWIDVCAPGGNQSFGNDCGVYSTLPDGKYGYMQGTSMACPHVSGLAALILSKTKGEGYTSQELYDHIVSTSNPSVYGKNPSYADMLGQGMIDVVQAFAKFSTTAPAAPVCYEYETASNTVTFKLDVPVDDDDAKAYYYEIYLYTSEVNESNMDQAARITLTINELNGSEDGLKYAVIKGLDFETEYHWAVAASDYAGNLSGLGSKGTFKTGPNAKPVISVSEEGDFTLSALDEVSRVFSYSDPDGHAVVASFKTTAKSGVEYSEISEGVAVVKISGKDSEPGTYEMEFTVTDEFGLAETYKATYEVLDNNAPVVSNEIGTVYVNGINGTVELPLKDYFKDPDGDELQAKLSVKDKNVATAAFQKKNIVLTGVSVGSTEVTIIVSDPSGAEVAAKFIVTVRDASNPYDIYPNPVIDVMNIRAFDEQEIKVTVYSATGKTVFESEGKISMKDVFTADLTSLAPGRYSVVIDPTEGKKYSSTIVKL